MNKSKPARAGGAKIKLPKTEKTKISYNKRQFYDRILTPMKGMGMIDYDLYKKQYFISDKFQKDMIRIGLMWNKEVNKQNLSAN